MKIGIANDMPLAVQAIRRALAQNGAHSVVWTATNGAEAVALCRQELPDLILMDLLMPEVDGVEAVRRIMAATPCPILIVTSDVDRNMSLVFRAMGHGAVDVVMTPTMGSRHAADAAALLRKIDNISWLTGNGRPKRAAPSPVPPRRHGRQHLVAIGASAGGPVSLERILRSLPADFPAGIVLVQHVDPVFAADMADWLSLTSAIPVRLARTGEVPLPGTVLLAGTSDHLAMDVAGRLAYVAEPAEHFYKPSIDVFFDAIVANWPGDAIGVLLTGMGQDGARGLKKLRDWGALTIAQDRATSAVYGMPKAAAELGAALEILPLSGIAPRLIEALA
ncbi:chemotaxis response regulator protein-glutamate methylesterase [Marinibaculum pumilum]|uniref:Protein-glutamate methylesterase/protein-glutamine glutaminase n=1 Tax=Marinibaculum pumilum TaxID=1766165 RepID=A0ABV7L934_9PROT